MKRPTSNLQSPISTYIIIALLLVSFSLRLHALLQLPGFIDEGNHLRWASEVWQGRWLFPLASGKPLLIYYEALFLPFPAALWLGRAASVLTGVVILSGLYALGRKWNRRTGFFAALFYAVTPWTFFHERLAVADSLVAACAVVMMVAVFRYVTRLQTRRVFETLRVSEIILVLSMIALPLAKLSAVTLLVMPIVIGLVKTRRVSPTPLRYGALRETLRVLWMPYVFAITVLAILLGYANSRYSVGQEVIQRAGFGQRTMMDWWVGNASDVVEWFRAYAIVIGLAIVAGIAIVLIRRQALGIIALIGFGISAGTYLFAPSTAYPRYYLPALAFGCLLAGLCLDLIWRTLPKYVVDRESKQAVLSLIMLIPLFSTVEFLLFVYPSYIAPAQLRLATVDRQQHITLWSSGYGIREAMQYVNEQAKKESEPSIVYVSDLAGMVTARLYWTGNGKVLTLWDATMGASVEDVDGRVASGKPTFLLVDTDHFRANFVGLEVNPHELARFQRPEGGKPIIVYRLRHEPFEFPMP